MGYNLGYNNIIRDLVGFRNKMKKINLIEILHWTLIVFGLVIIYQMIKKILGGSWGFETVIITLLMFNLGLTFTTTFNFNRHRGEFREFKRAMLSMARDFKEFRKEVREKFEKIDKRFEKIDRKFEKIDRKFEGKFDNIDRKISNL